MRARNLKPGTFKNEILGTADPLFTILFEGLWCMADRAGRLEDRPLRICAEIFPYRRKISEKRADEMLWWLDENGFVARYQISAEQFIQVIEFDAHQNPHKDERQSIIQPFTPDLHRARTVPTQKLHRRKAEVVRLIPSSLTPDSGFLTPDSPFTDSRNPVPAPVERGGGTGQSGGEEGMGPEHPKPGPNGNGVHRSDDWNQFQRVRAAYPKGIYPEADWLEAQRFVSQRIEEGHTWDQVVAGCERFAAQCAVRFTSTQYVESPKKFFASKVKFMDPFPLPVRSERAHPEDTGWRPTE